MNGFWEYIERQINLIPQTVYEVLLVSLIIAFIGLVMFTNRVAKLFAWMIFAEYLFIVYGITVFFRDVNPNYSNYLTPFWNYKEMIYGPDPSLLYEVIMNVVLFIPIGFLWGSQSKAKSKKQQWLVAFVLGMGLSIGIEVLQLEFKKGSFEIDDIIHNTVGCMLGFAVCKGCEKLVKAVKNKLIKKECNN